MGWSINLASLFICKQGVYDAYNYYFCDENQSFPIVNRNLSTIGDMTKRFAISAVGYAKGVRIIHIKPFFNLSFLVWKI